MVTSVQKRDALRQRLLFISTLGFLSGYYLLPNQWLHVGWMILMLAACIWGCGWSVLTAGLRQDAWLRLTGCWFFALLVRSSVLDSPGMRIEDLWAGWFHAALLLLVLGMLWQMAGQQTACRKITLPLTLMALLAAVTSILFFYVFADEALMGARLCNWFVFGGWNPVCTGLTFGFAAVWALNAWHSQPPTGTVRGRRQFWLAVSVMLLLATLLTMSRGAVLALISASISLFFSQNWRRALRPLGLLAVCFLLFQHLAPAISNMGVTEISDRLAIPKTSVTKEVVADRIIAADPMARFIERADTGRFTIYSAALSSMTSWQDWLLGKGLWSANDFWSCSLPWNPEHLHSIYMDALVRGGLPGLLGLLFLTGWGLQRALRLAKRGEPLWLMLICYGVSGVLFDGASAFSALSISRYEMLIFWVPLVMASARYAVIRSQEAPLSSEHSKQEVLN